MSERSGRPQGSGLVGVGVLVAMLLGWWLFSGNGPGGPPGSASRMTEPGTAPVSPGATTETEVQLVPGALPLVTWSRQGPTTLELTYRRGGDDCFGRLATPRVEESEVAVTITLFAEDGTSPCPQATTGTVVVDLDGEVGDRSVLDGAYVGRRVRVPPS